MRRLAWSAVLLLTTAAAGDALAQNAPATSASPQRVPPSAQGLAVFAGRDAADAAWPLAQQIYGRASLRPAGLDEARARVLAGEDPAADAPTAVRELAETRDAIRGDDAPSRQLLTSIGQQLHVRGILVVRLPAEAVRLPTPSARVFLVETGTFDAASYAPDAPSSTSSPAPSAKPAWSWTGTVGSLDRAYGAPSSTPAASRAGTPAPKAAFAGTANPASQGTKDPSRDGARGGGGAKPFYTSPWFWGAIAISAAAGVGIFLATRDGSSDTIHLQMQVPR